METYAAMNAPALKRAWTMLQAYAPANEWRIAATEEMVRRGLPLEPMTEEEDRAYFARDAAVYRAREEARVQSRMRSS